MRTEGFYAGRKIVVTGDTGFKGAWLSLALHQAGAHVVGVGLDPENEEGLYTQAGLANLVEHVTCDIRDADGLSRVFERINPEFVFHLAAQSLVRRSYSDPLATVATNVLGTANVLESVRRCSDVVAVIVATSDKCYAESTGRRHTESDELGGADLYSASKACAELVTSSFRVSFLTDVPVVATVRAGNVIGGGDWSEDRIVPDMVRALRARTSLSLRHPAAVRPWQHVLDPIAGYLTIAKLSTKRPETSYSGAWNFGPSETSERTVAELVETFRQTLGISFAVDRPSGGSHQALREAPDLRLDSTKAHEELGWSPEWSFEEAVALTAGWYGRWLNGEDAFALSTEQIRMSHSLMEALN